MTVARQQNDDKWVAYRQAKTANARFALHLDVLGETSGLDSPFARFIGVEAHATDADEAARLWTMSAELTAVDAIT